MATASEYNLDSARICLAAGSAGTPLASLTAQRRSDIKCFIGYNGIYNFVNNPGSTFPPPGNYYAQNIPNLTSNSSIFNLRNPPPATLLLHGTLDTTINSSQSALFSDKIVKSGGVATNLLYEGEKHAFFNLNHPADIPTTYEVGKFLQLHLPKSYEFNQAGNKEGWQHIKLVETNPSPASGKWLFKAFDPDPALLSPSLRISAFTNKKIKIKMLNNGGDKKNSLARLFWRSGTEQFNALKSSGVTVDNSGVWGEYVFDMSKNPNWVGEINQIRIDPVLNGDGHEVGIDYIRFE